MIGSAAMCLSSVSVVLNALRLRSFRPSLDADPEKEQTVKAAPVKERENTQTQDIQNSHQERKETNMTKVFHVEGMMCQHCRAHVLHALEGVPGVESAEVDLEKAEARVSLKEDVADETLIGAVTGAGYQATRLR